jgi:nicotinate-nucleotide pyrophosphorylase
MLPVYFSLTVCEIYTGSIPNAIADVECTSESEPIQAIESGADVIMLDNFTRDDLDKCCKTLKEKYGEKTKAGDGGRKWLIEVSGGVTPENFEELAHPGECARRPKTVDQRIGLLVAGAKHPS